MRSLRREFFVPMAILTGTLEEIGPALSCVVAQRLCQPNGPAKTSVNGFAQLLPLDGAFTA